MVSPQYLVLETGSSSEGDLKRDVIRSTFVAITDFCTSRRLLLNSIAIYINIGWPTCHPH